AAGKGYPACGAIHLTICRKKPSPPQNFCPGLWQDEVTRQTVPDAPVLRKYGEGPSGIFRMEKHEEQEGTSAGDAEK
ncbi:hypothetical protein, partial [Desulfovibrio piger]|uniref:hypothetical protein n=1 Tax=Desulfovibrio piger TaxID=901 RepID=UPI0026EBD2DC